MNRNLQPALFPNPGGPPPPNRFPFKGQVLEEKRGSRTPDGYYDPYAEEERFELQDEVRGAALEVRVPFTRLEGVAREGALLTQHETGSSGGGYDPTARAEHERAMGFTDHPVYGHLTNPSNTWRDDASQYGGSRFRMKPHVRDRTTVTAGDSWVESTRKNPPVPLRDVEAGRAVPPKTDAVGDEEFSRGDMDYLEAQIHNPSGKGYGRVPLEDVESLDIDYSWKSGPSPGVGRQFSDKGVSVWHNTRHQAYQAPLPFSSEELTEQQFRPRGGVEEGGWLRTARGGGGAAENLTGFLRTRHQSQLERERRG